MFSNFFKKFPTTFVLSATGDISRRSSSKIKFKSPHIFTALEIIWRNKLPFWTLRYLIFWGQWIFLVLFIKKIQWNRNNNWYLLSSGTSFPWKPCHENGTFWLRKSTLTYPLLQTYNLYLQILDPAILARLSNKPIFHLYTFAFILLLILLDFINIEISIYESPCCSRCPVF